MKKLILGIFLVQIVIIGFFGIPAGGAATAVWRDQQTGLLANQSSPQQALSSFYQLVAEDGYQGAVSIFSAADQASINSDLLAAYFQQSGLAKAKMIGVYAAPAVGGVDVAATVQLVDNGTGTVQPMVAFHTLKLSSGRWEIVQQVDQANPLEIKMVLERAVKLCDIILGDALNGLTPAQKDQVVQQVTTGRQMMVENLEQINALPQAE